MVKNFLFLASVFFLSFGDTNATPLTFKIGHLEVTTDASEEVSKQNLISIVNRGISTKIDIDGEIFYSGLLDEKPVFLNSKFEEMEIKGESNPIGDVNKMKAIVNSAGKKFEDVKKITFYELKKTDKKKCDTCQSNRQCVFKGCRCKCNWESTKERFKGKCCNNEYGKKCDREGPIPKKC